MTAVSKTASARTDPDIDVDIRCGLWREALPHVTKLCRRAAEAAWAGATQPGVAGGEISIVMADDEFIQGLNRSWRKQDAPTNVLAFPASGDEPPIDGIRLLGDVVVAFQTSRREAGEQSKSFDDHVAHLIVHGVLHLLGYDHQADDEAGRMEMLEADVLAVMGIENPYGDHPRMHDGRP